MGKPVGEQAAALAKRLRAELELYPAGRRFLSHGEIRKRFGANLRVVMAALELLRAEGRWSCANGSAPSAAFPRGSASR